MKKNLLVPAICALLFVAAMPLVPFANWGMSVAQAAPAEAWRAEFDDICAKTDGAESLSKEELKGLIERCEKLRPEIEKLDESARKLYLKRLQMCRDLFAYVLETKEEEAKP